MTTERQESRTGADDSRRANRTFARFRRTGSPAAIPELFDLVQVTFLVAMEKSATFDEDRDVLPWLTGILRNQGALVHRRRHRQPDAKRLAREVAVDPASQAESAELEREVARAVAQLPPDAAAALLAFAGWLAATQLGGASGPGTSERGERQTAWLEQPPAAGDVSSERGDGRTQAVTAPSRTVPTTELRGVVRDAAGTGVAGAMVLGWSRRESPTHLGEGRFDPPPHGSTETTTDGSFRLRARGGVFHLLAVHGERMSTHGIIGVQEGRTEIEGLVFELAPTAVREGRLLDDAGEPVGGHEFGTDLSVDFSDELDRLDVPGFRRTKPPGLRVVTGTDGTFRARGLLEHSYPWEVKHPEHPMLRQRHAPKDGFLELRLETGERLAGIVFRADGSPAAGARAPQRLPSSGSRLRCRRPVRARRRGAPGRALPASCRISVHLLACCT